jgi:hypothetical protein
MRNLVNAIHFAARANLASLARIGINGTKFWPDNWNHLPGCSGVCRVGYDLDASGREVSDE